MYCTCSVRTFYARYDNRDHTTQPPDRPGAAHSLLSASTRRCLGNLDLSGQAVSDRVLDRHILSNRAPGFRMGGMAA